MSKDLVERLRAAANSDRLDIGSAWNLMDEAADALEAAADALYRERRDASQALEAAEAKLKEAIDYGVRGREGRMKERMRITELEKELSDCRGTQHACAKDAEPQNPDFSDHPAPGFALPVVRCVYAG